MYVGIKLQYQKNRGIWESRRGKRGGWKHQKKDKEKDRAETEKKLSSSTPNNNSARLKLELRKLENAPINWAVSDC